jgi:signal transduction histidine kinase
MSYAPGEITIESGSQDGHVFVAVRDHGPGIPEDELARVTERFYRGRGTPSGGSGLGLAIARDLAEKWGGSMAVTSAVGDGTRVEVRLRAAAI